MGNPEEQPATDLSSLNGNGSVEVHKHPMDNIGSVCPVCSYDPESEHLSGSVDIVSVRETWARTLVGGKLEEIEEYEKHALTAVVAVRVDEERIVAPALIGFLNGGGRVLLGSSRGENNTIVPIVHNVPSNGTIHGQSTAA